ncbi:hypothetical protein GCM10009565_48960 [Amycolatopsis albidoflavus]
MSEQVAEPPPESVMEGEMTDSLGCDKHVPAGRDTGIPDVARIKALTPRDHTSAKRPGSLTNAMHTPPARGIRPCSSRCRRRR